MLNKNKRLNIRVSEKTLALIKERSKSHGVSQSRLVTIATQIVTDEDIFQYLLDKIPKNVEIK